MIPSIDERVEAAHLEMGQMRVEEENLAAFWPDAQSLLRHHWEEIAAHKDIPLTVNLRVYEQLEAEHHLCIVAARASGRLVGYAVFFVSPHPHYKTSLQAQEDVIYLHPALRGSGYGRELLRASERVLRRRGCQLVHHHVKIAHPALGLLLQTEGYQPVETIFSKRLDDR